MFVVLEFKLWRIQPITRTGLPGHVMSKKEFVLEIGDRSGIEGHNLNYESSLLFRKSVDMGVNDLSA